jgi:hypothetical protein
MLPRLMLQWAPITGTANYSTTGATVTPHNGVLVANTTATVTAHLIAGTPGTGKNRLGT